MASCSSPPKKRPKLSLKFMRKDRTPTVDDTEGVSSHQKRIRQSTTPNGHSSTAAASSSTSQEPVVASTPSSSSKSTQQELARLPPAPYAGLQNLGNTCYLNSVLQALRFCPGFCRGLCQLACLWEKLRTLKGAQEEVMDDDSRKIHFVLSLKKLYDVMLAKEAEFITGTPDIPLTLSPDEVLETVRELNPMFQGFLQHDSQELLCCLLSYVLDACQSLQKQLVKLHSPPPQQHSKELNSTPCSTSNHKGSVNGKGNGTKTGHTDESPMDLQSGDSVARSTSSSQRDSAINGNGDATPLTSNGKKAPRRHSRTPSSDSVAGGKSRTPLATEDGKTTCSLTNGFNNHVQGTNGKSCPETPQSNGSGHQHEGATKKKRLGKFRISANQTTLLGAFTSMKVQGTLPNGIRANHNSSHLNGIDSDSKSNIQSNGTTTSNSPAVPPADVKSEDKLSIIHTGASRDTNNKAELKKTSKAGIRTSANPPTVSATGSTNHAIDGCTALGEITATNSEADRAERELDMIRGLFQGALVLRTRCNECESYTERREEFQDISLPVRSIVRSTRDDEEEGISVAPADLSLSWAISEFACVERLTDDNKYFCEHCRHHAEAERSMLFGDLPPVLTIHLKRFSAFATCLTADSTVSKVNDHLATPLSLRLSQWCSKQCKQLHSTYHLCAVVMHSGVSSSSGHYISYVQIPDRLDPSSDVSCSNGDPGGDGGGLQRRRELSWGKFDDEKVSILSQQELAASVLHPVSSSGSAATPYLLFYRQVQESD